MDHWSRKEIAKEALSILVLSLGWILEFTGGAVGQMAADSPSILATEWKQLTVKYPERFILGFDNVWPEHWGKFYLDQVALWRGAIRDLPAEVPHAFAHGNAERLWRLPPSR